jgi:DinB family protein
MKEIIEQLQTIIAKYTPLLRNVNKDAWTIKPRADKWSKAEELGHVIDSAQNNIRRFIVGQYEDQPHIVYKQDEWAKIANYQNYPVNDLIDFWIQINKHICIILKNTSVEKAKRLVLTQEVHSIEWLAADYNKHLLHHMHHLLELEPIAYP